MNECSNSLHENGSLQVTTAIATFNTALRALHGERIKTDIRLAMLHQEQALLASALQKVLPVACSSREAVLSMCALVFALQMLYWRCHIYLCYHKAVTQTMQLISCVVQNAPCAPFCVQKIPADTGRRC